MGAFDDSARVEEADQLITFKDSETGSTTRVPSSILDKPNELRRRIRLGDVQSVLTSSDAEVTVDAARRQYRMAHYPPVGELIAGATASALPQLGFLRARYLYVVFGCLLVAAAAQIQFFFPCLPGYTTVSFEGDTYCVPNDRMGEVSPAACPPDACSQRIPVTMQTYAVLLNGAIAGNTGGLATALYVLLVCLGAPFGAGGKVDPVWNLGAVVGSSGGFFWGFIAASFIMARCASKGHDRPRSAYWMVLWMVAAEAAIYACGLFWLPFGIAISAKIPIQEVCPAKDGAISCLNNIFAWGFTPFLPGDAFKMLLVLLTVPLLWKLALLWTTRTHAAQLQLARSPQPLEGGDDKKEGDDATGTKVRAGSASETRTPSAAMVNPYPVRPAGAGGSGAPASDWA